MRGEIDSSKSLLQNRLGLSVFLGGLASMCFGKTHPRAQIEAHTLVQSQWEP